MMKKSPACLLVLGLALALPRLPAAPEDEVAVTFTGDPGVYRLPQWKKDWPGCTFEGGVRDGRVSLVETDEKRWLRVTFKEGEIGPEKGGAGWRWPVGRREKAELSYTLRFGKGFPWVKGGKLPGLCGGPDNVSGGRPATGANGFSARLMWRRDGRGEAYVYHKNQPSRYGESFPFPEEFRFPQGVPIQVRIFVAMNSAGRRDGVLKVWVSLPQEPSRLVVEQTGMEWRDEGTFGVDSLYFETFHGGSDATWAPQEPSWAEFAGFRVTTPP